MKKWMKEENIQLSPQRNMQYLLLLVICITETLFIITEGMFQYMGYYLTETYLIVPGMMLLGTAVAQKLSRAAKSNLLLSTLAVVWFVIAQIQHRSVGMQAYPMDSFFVSYLVAFPFASIMEDHEKNIGMKLGTTLFLAAALVLVGYSILLILGCLPESMKNFVYWDGTRLYCMWHPNVSACIFMIGIGSSLSYLFHTRKTWKKCLLVVSVVLQFVAMSLTNCRTSILMTCFFMGCAAFFSIHRGGWKRFLAGAGAACVVTAALFFVSSGIYELNQNLHKASAAEQLAQQAEAEKNPVQETTAPETEPTQNTEDMPDADWYPKDAWLTEEEWNNREAWNWDETTPPETEPPEPQKVITQEIHVDQETGDITIRGGSNQKSLLDDLRTLNNRTAIWAAALEALNEEPGIKQWGTEYVGLMLSVYGPFTVEHTHNSWMETLMSLGMPGLWIALIYTAIALWSAAVLLVKSNVERWKKMITVLMLCLLVAAFLEPYLFFAKNCYQFIDFVFFLYLGYIDMWRRQALHPEAYPVKATE